MPVNVIRPPRHMSHYTRSFGTRSHTFSPGANTLTVGSYRTLVHPGVGSGIPLPIGKTNNQLRSLTTCPPISESEPMQGPAPPYYTSSPRFPRLLSDGYLYGNHSPASLHPSLNKRFSAPVAREMLRSASTRSLHDFNSPRIAHSNAWIFASNPPSRNDSHESLHNPNDKANIPATSFPYGASGLVNLRQHSHTSLSSLPTTAHDYQHHVRPNALDTSMAAGLREGYFYHFHCKCGHTICVPMQPPGATAYPKAELVKQTSNGSSPRKDMENGVHEEYAKQVERQSSSGDKGLPKDVHHTTKNIQPKNLFVNKVVLNQRQSRSRENSLQERNESLTRSQGKFITLNTYNCNNECTSACIIADTKSHTSSTDTLDDGKPQSLGAAANISHHSKSKRISFLGKPRAKQVEPNKVIWPIKREKLNKYIYKHTNKLLTCKSRLELIPPNDKIRGPLPKLCLQLHPYGTEEDGNRCVTAKVMIENPKNKCQLHSDTMIEFVISAREDDAHSGAEIGRIRTKQKLVTQSHFYVKGIITHESLKKSSSDYVQIEATVAITQDS